MKPARQSREDPGRPKQHSNKGPRGGKELRFGSQNVRTMMDSTTGDAPARRTAHIAAELARARADVVALSETRIHGKGSCQEGEFVFHWHGYDEGDRRQGTGGVGVVLSRNAQKELAGPPAYYSPRVMSVRFNFNLTFVSVYAPTFHAPESDKQEFYNQLQAAVDSAPRGNIVVIAGDFNARVGTNAAAWDGVMGPH
jgi:exonuclease III